MVASPPGRTSRQPLLEGQAASAGHTTRSCSVGRVFGGLLALTIAFCVGRYSAFDEDRVNNEGLAAIELETTPHRLWEPTLNPAFDGEPIAKSAVRRFDAFLMQKAAFVDPQTKLANCRQWLAQDFLYEVVGFPGSNTLEGWVMSGEEHEFRTTFNVSLFSQMLFLGSDDMATTTSYGNVFWSQPLFGIAAPKGWVYFRVTDFYSSRKTSPTSGLLYYNFMMIDFADLLRQVGRSPLPKATLPEGLVLSSAANDGVPAPLSVVARTQDQATARQVALAALHEDWAGNSTPAADAWVANLAFYGPGGIGMARGVDEYRQHVLAPFRAAFEDRRVETRISGCEGNYCGAFGNLHGRHVGTWLGLKASGTQVTIRFAFHWHVADGKVQEGWAILDVPGLFAQLGMDFFAIAAATPLQI